MLKPKTYVIEWRLRPSPIYSPHATKSWTVFKSIEAIHEAAAQMEVDELNDRPEAAFEFRLQQPQPQ